MQAIQPKIGLALSGGGARGFAHIGILKILEEAGIQIDCVSGTSMGGIIAAAFATGISLTKIEEHAIRLSSIKEIIKLADLTPPRRGILEGKRVHEYLREIFDEEITFEDLPIPLALNAVDLLTGEEIVLKNGALLPAILATICVPGLFTPVEMGDFQLVDGGVLNNVPTSWARELGAEFIIAVDVQLDPRNQPPWQDQPHKPHWPLQLPEFFLDFYRAELIMVARLTHQNLAQCPADVLIQPPIADDITMFFGFLRAGEIIAAGEEAARQALPQIQQLLSSYSPDIC